MFDRKMDMLNTDLALKNEFDDRKKPNQKVQDTKKKGNKVTEVDYSDDEGAFHFIAYVPIYGEVWKLDGLDRQPQKLGECRTPLRVSIETVTYSRLPIKASAPKENGYRLWSRSLQSEWLNMKRVKLNSVCLALSTILLLITRDSLRAIGKAFRKSQRVSTC